MRDAITSCTTWKKQGLSRPRRATSSTTAWFEQFICQLGERAKVIREIVDDQRNASMMGRRFRRWIHHDPVWAGAYDGVTTD